MRVDSLHFYPVKSGRGVDLTMASVEQSGIVGDRRWLITDEADKFLTQREAPQLATIQASSGADGVRLACAGAGAIDVGVPDSGLRRNNVTVWGDEIAALPAEPAVNQWLCEALGMPVRLYYMDDDARRTTSPMWSEPAPLSFADGFPLLITTQASLRRVNEEIASQGGEAVGMERFRPNIVIADTDPWADDYWKNIRIGDVELALVKPCDRCVITTRDQKTGADMGREPLASLVRLRRSADRSVKGVLFGWNACVLKAGYIRIGDAVEVLEKRPEGWPIAPPPQ